MKQISRRNKILVLLVFSACFAVGQSVVKVYIGMPYSIDAVMSKQSKKDLVEFYKAGMVSTVTNAFNKSVSVLKLDSVNNILKIQNTATSTIELKVITSGKSYLTGVIRTVCAPVCTSHLRFYDPKWNEIHLNFMPPTASNWLVNERADSANLDKDWLKSQLEESYVTLEFAANSNLEIIAQNHAGELWSDEVKRTIYPLLSTESKHISYKTGKWEIN